jgi:hypothetical protein
MEALLQATLTAIKPQELKPHIVAEGDPGHTHAYAEEPWDSELYGKRLVDFDDVKTNPFAKVTYREPHVCPCGRKVIFSTRSLI